MRGMTIPGKRVEAAAAGSDVGGGMLRIKVDSLCRSTARNGQWADPGLNRGPSDFQSLALPTELSARLVLFSCTARRCQLRLVRIRLVLHGTMSIRPKIRGPGWSRLQ